jgi:hypothetical protein
MTSIKFPWLVRGLASLILTVSCGGCYWGCGGGGSTSDPNRGFDVETIVRSNGVDFAQTARVVADFQYATGTTTGNVEHFNQFVNLGFTQFTGARVPGVWRFAASGYAGCPGVVPAEREMKLGNKIRLTCFTFGVGLFSSSPDSVDVTSPPATGTITGSGIDPTYGMPTVAYYNENGSLVADQVASSVASDGSWLQGPVPDFSSSYNGQYTLLVSNKNADGTTTIIGSAYITVTGFYIMPEPEPEPDPCGCTKGIECPDCAYIMY